MYRATKSGLGAEAQAKVESKYDDKQASECLQWVLSTLQHFDHTDTFEVEGDRRNFESVLNDGFILAKLINCLQPGSIPANKMSKRPTMPFKKMELIGLFLDKIKAYGVSDHELFATIDLTESQNLYQVVICLQALGRKARINGHIGFGPQESQGNVRNFSEEQLKAGQNVISLQYGTNKGASQAGMNFGKQRMIID